MGRKNLNENGRNPFFRLVFQSYGNEIDPDSYPVQRNPFGHFVNIQTDLVPRFVRTIDTKLQTDFARGATITTFGHNAARTLTGGCSEGLNAFRFFFKLKYIITSATNAAATANYGRIEVNSF